MLKKFTGTPVFCQAKTRKGPINFPNNSIADAGTGGRRAPSTAPKKTTNVPIVML
jgi:hypothetical protein